MRNRKSVKERLDKLILSGKADECWLWTGSTLGIGYGSIKVWNGMKWITGTAHRETLKLFSPEPDPPNNHALHSCDNPPCCNPAHLSWGSPSDNRKQARDRLHNQGNQKLTPNQVLEIRLSTKKYSDIAAEYLVHYMTIARIKQNRGWKPQ